MTSSFTLNANTSGYTVDVIDPSAATGRTHNKLFRTVFAVFMGLFLAVSSIFAAPAPASAWIDDAVRSVFCSSIFFNAKPDGLWGQPATVEDKNLDTYQMTAYEKYGASGANWTVWVGPDEQEEMDDDGKMGGRQLVALAGGPDSDSGIEYWGDKMKPTDAPVFFNADQACGDPVNFGWSMVGNFLMMINGGIVYISGFIFQTAYESSASVISEMDETIEEMVKTLTQSFYMAFFNIMVMLAALWMGYKGLVKKQSTEMAQGAIWMIAAAAIGMFMLAQPLMISKGVNTVVTTASEAAITTITSSSTKELSGSDSNALCYVESGGNGADADGDKLKTATRGSVRAMQCSLWESFIYNPWAIGQFGHLPGQEAENGINYIDAKGEAVGDYGKIDTDKTRLLKDTTIPEKIDMGGREIDANWSILQLDSRVSHQLDNGKAGELTVKQGRQMLHIASGQTLREDPNKNWAGQSSINRVFTASIALIASFGAAIMIIILAMEMIILQIGLVILVLLAPIFALVGVHPGFGRRIALMWLNTIGELALRRIVLSILLAVMITFYAIVLNASASAPWMVSMIMVVAVSIGGLMYKNKILGMFSNSLNMGGAGTLPFADGRMGDRLLSKGMGVAGTAGKFALAGGVAGVAAGLAGAGARRNANKAVDDHMYQDFLNKKNAENSNGEGGAGAGGQGQGGAGSRPNGTPVGPNNGPGTEEGLAGAGANPNGLGEGDINNDNSVDPDSGFQDGSAYAQGVDSRVAPVLTEKPEHMTDEEWEEYQALAGAGERTDANPEAQSQDDSNLGDAAAAGAVGGAAAGAVGGAISNDEIEKMRKRMDAQRKNDARLNGTAFVAATNEEAMRRIQERRQKSLERVGNMNKKFSGVTKPVGFVGGVGAGAKRRAGQFKGSVASTSANLASTVAQSRAGRGVQAAGASIAQATDKTKARASNAALSAREKASGVKDAAVDAHSAAKQSLPGYSAVTGAGANAVGAVGGAVAGVGAKRAQKHSFNEAMKIKEREDREAKLREQREFAQYKAANKAAYKADRKALMKDPEFKSNLRAEQSAAVGTVVRGVTKGNMHNTVRALKEATPAAAQKHGEKVVQQTEKARKRRGEGGLSQAAQNRIKTTPDGQRLAQPASPAPSSKSAPQGRTERNAPAQPASQRTAPASAPRQGAPSAPSAPRSERKAPSAPSEPRTERAAPASREASKPAPAPRSERTAPSAPSEPRTERRAPEPAREPKREAPKPTSNQKQESKPAQVKRDAPWGSTKAPELKREAPKPAPAPRESSAPEPKREAPKPTSNQKQESKPAQVKRDAPWGSTKAPEPKREAPSAPREPKAPTPKQDSKPAQVKRDAPWGSSKAPEPKQESKPEPKREAPSTPREPKAPKGNPAEAFGRFGGSSPFDPRGAQKDAKDLNRDPRQSPPDELPPHRRPNQ